MNVKLFLFTGATILSLVLGSVGVSAVLPDQLAAAASAIAGAVAPAGQDPARRGARIYGVIDAVDGTTLALATPAGPLDLLTDANTIFRIPGVEDPGLDDLAVGDPVGAAGWWDGDARIFHAFGVAMLADDRTLPLPGKLASIDDDTLTVETRYGPATAHVDDGTEYRIRGMENPGLDDLEVGMKVVVQGTLNADGSLQAQVVAGAKVGPRQGRLRGEVTAVEGDTFTVHTQRGRQVTVLTDDETKFRVPGVEDPTIADLQVGDKVVGEGVIEEDGTARATLVVVLPEDAALLKGEVAAVEGTTLVLETRGGTVDVLTDADTVFRIPGVEEPTPDDVEVGSNVVAGGAWEDASTFHAVGVGVVDGQRPGQRAAVRGRAVSVGTDSLVLGTPRGPVTVLVDEETRYRVPGVDDAGLDDIEEGMLVGARGVWNEDGTLQAAGVGVLPGRQQQRGGGR